MFILSIESSCDETSLALLSGKIDVGMDFFEQINSFVVLGSLISSQIEIHKKYGGVVPEIGARQHAENIHWLFQNLLDETCLQHGFEQNDLLAKIQHIFVTSSPGLISALRVGMEFGKSLQFFLQKKFGSQIELDFVNHLEGHILSCFYQKPISKNSNSFYFTANNLVETVTDSELFPHLHLLVSGGNTQLILLQNNHAWQIVGQTLDDAAGESFDKIGRMLGLPYPGGIHLAKIAGLEMTNYFDFPISMSKSQSLDFSFSGLKTAVRYFLEKAQVADFKFEKALSLAELQILETNNLDQLANPKLQFLKKVAISSQFVIVKQLLNQFKKAILKHNPHSIGISGGVSANLLLRQEIQALQAKKMFIAPKELTGDNAIMIALSGLNKKITCQK